MHDIREPYPWWKCSDTLPVRCCLCLFNSRNSKMHQCPCTVRIESDLLVSYLCTMPPQLLSMLVVPCARMLLKRLSLVMRVDVSLPRRRGSVLTLGWHVTSIRGLDARWHRPREAVGLATRARTRCSTSVAVGVRSARAWGPRRPLPVHVALLSLVMPHTSPARLSCAWT